MKVPILAFRKAGSSGMTTIAGRLAGQAKMDGRGHVGLIDVGRGKVWPNGGSTGPCGI